MGRSHRAIRAIRRAYRISGLNNLFSTLDQPGAHGTAEGTGDECALSAITRLSNGSCPVFKTATRSPGARYVPPKRLGASRGGPQADPAGRAAGEERGPEVTGSAGPSSAPAADQLSAAEREERRRQAEIAINKRLDKLNQSARRAMNGICVDRLRPGRGLWAVDHGEQRPPLTQSLRFR